ncbi:hypothetical protein [Actinoplanes utahensis]|nr:hypothetical protein [Actinoplanes utahensis]GIF27267.1 hypothetical protein Aut01nite_02530 [Actinoplanes utahensis]
MATREVSFREFATIADNAAQKPVFVTVRAGQVVSVARLNVR